jgi:hypothetical protein
MVGHETSCHANLENGKFHWDVVIVLWFSTLQLAVKNYFPTSNRLLRDSAPPLFPIKIVQAQFGDGNASGFE